MEGLSFKVDKFIVEREIERRKAGRGGSRAALKEAKKEAGSGTAADEAAQGRQAGRARSLEGKQGVEAARQMLRRQSSGRVAGQQRALRTMLINR